MGSGRYRVLGLRRGEERVCRGRDGMMRLIGGWKTDNVWWVRGLSLVCLVSLSEFLVG